MYRGRKKINVYTKKCKFSSPGQEKTLYESKSSMEQDMIASSEWRVHLGEWYHRLWGAFWKHEVKKHGDRWWGFIFFMLMSLTHTQHSINGRKYSRDYHNPKFEGIRRTREEMCLGILVFINMYFISSNCLIIINIIIFIFVSSQTNLIDRIMCPCYHMIQLALISSHFIYFLLTDCTTHWCSLISICNVISQE